MKSNISTVLMSFFIACFTLSCNKDNGSSLKGIEFEEDEITLEVNKKYTPELVAIPYNADLPECRFTSDDRSIATVNKSTGEITAVAKGEAVITAKTSDGKFVAECYVTVVPAGSGGELYREPYLTFGASKTTVKNYETRKLGSETSDMLIYEGENNDVLAVAYSFEVSKMDLVLVVFGNTTNIKNKAINHLKSKYEYLDEEDGEYYFISSNGKVGIILYYDDEDLDCWVAFYIDMSSLKSTKSSFSKEKVKQRFMIPERIFTLLGD